MSATATPAGVTLAIGAILALGFGQLFTTNTIGSGTTIELLYRRAPMSALRWAAAVSGSWRGVVPPAGLPTPLASLAPCPASAGSIIATTSNSSISSRSPPPGTNSPQLRLLRLRRHAVCDQRRDAGGTDQHNRCPHVGELQPPCRQERQCADLRSRGRRWRQRGIKQGSASCG